MHDFTSGIVRAQSATLSSSVSDRLQLVHRILLDRRAPSPRKAARIHRSTYHSFEPARKQPLKAAQQQQYYPTQPLVAVSSFTIPGKIEKIAVPSTVGLRSAYPTGGPLLTSKTEDPRQTGTESRATGRENQVPPASRRWVPPSLRPHHGLTEEARIDSIFRKVGFCKLRNVIR